MASVDKVKVADTTYDVSPSKDGTLNGYTSGDSVSPSSWGNVDAITTSDTNSGIFNKITTMIRNIRWLYNKLGTVDISATGSDTISGGLVGVQNGLNGKANTGHSHGVGDLPVSNSSVNSTSYVPSSAVVYGLKSVVESLSSEIDELTRADDDPNTRYEAVSLGTWSSVSDVTTFLSKYTRENGYYDYTTGTKLKLGNYVTIQDGTYNAVWEIAGFDMEYNQTAADGTVYDNGYGICMIPKTYVTKNKWNTSNTTTGGYKSSYMHNTVLPGIVTTLKTVLGDHVVNRNVLLSSSVDGSYSSAYTWTTAYATLMSIGQMNGTFASNRNKYDDGEANYKLPVFNYEAFKIGSNFWPRGVGGSTNAVIVYGDGSISTTSANYTNGVRPLIYLRLDATNMIMPNARYNPRDLGTWSSVDQVAEFLSKYTHENGYYDSESDTKLGLGDYVTIQDGTYNVQWEIAGFDTEYNRTASDGTVYNNGYGICLIPKTQVTTGKWNTTASTTGGYESSNMHKTVLSDIVTNLKTVLGDHIVNRNVLLSSTVSSNKSSAYIWTTAYATLMPIGQMNGTFATHTTKYDDGEANYKLPLFNYESFNTGSNFWSRGVVNSNRAWYVDADGSINVYDTNNTRGVRPLIYLRRNAANEPNVRYAPRDLGTWSSVDQVAEFLSKYTHENGYYDAETDTMLGLGDYVTIQDGTYNAVWEIAGFDTEYNRIATDGTTYNNGYGICLIPKTQVTTGKWNATNTTKGGYKSSYMYTTVLPNIVTTLKNVLGDHIVNRNVLLSSTVTNGNSSAYTWTTADATLMSVGQMTGTFAKHDTKYDDGEANYKLPLFNYESYWAGSVFWSRGVGGSGVRYVNGASAILGAYPNNSIGVRPLIYLR